MAVATYQNNSNSGQTSSSNTLDISKPTGLSVGDLMVAFVGSGNATTTPPAGWTSIFSANNYVLAYKVADSSDVAASGFTFTYSISTTARQGVIARITGQSTANIGNYSHNYTTGSTTHTTTTITPTQKNSLILLFDTGSGSGSGNTVSSYSIVNDNPTWTTDLNANYSTTTLGIFMAHATRLQNTATGTATVTWSFNSVGVTAILEIPVLPTQQTISENITLTETINKKIIITFNEVLSITESLGQSISRLWNKVTKPINTWTNKPKN